jgi:hypothetical protein
MPSSSRRWIAFFLILAVLGVAAVSINLVYNLSLKLRPEQVARARELWRRNAPADYDLEWLVRTSRGGDEQDDEFFLAVRGGRPVFLGCDGEVLYAEAGLALVAGPGLLALPRQDPRAQGVEAMFRRIEEALRHDAAAGGRIYCTAMFDPRNGHPLRFVHRVPSTRERVEWIVRLTERSPR